MTTEMSTEVQEALDAMSRDRQLAVIAATPEHNHSVLQQKYSTVGGVAEADGFELFAVLSEQIDAVKGGDLSQIEATLMAQIKTMDTIFVNLATRASMNIGEHFDAMERYMRLAFKAQAQCRATAEALAEIKQPRSVAFVRQANIANNQQVNNGCSTSVAPARAIQNQSDQNELLEVIQSERLDTRASIKAGAIDSTMAAVEAINGANER